MHVSPPVELTQLGQLPKQLINHERVATRVLLMRQRMPHLRNSGPRARPVPDPAPRMLRGHCLSRPSIACGCRCPQIALAQARHFEASTAFGSLQNGQVFTSAGAGSLTNIREIHQTTRAIATKAMIALMNEP